MASLKENIRITDIEAKRLKQAFESLESCIPLTTDLLENFSHERLTCLDSLVWRFSKLQDIMGSRVFPSLLDALQENRHSLTMIDQVNLLERREFLPSSKIWWEVRQARNSVAHEYPEDPEQLAFKLNHIIRQAEWLLAYWDWLKEEIDNRIFLD